MTRNPIVLYSQTESIGLTHMSASYSEFTRRVSTVRHIVARENITTMPISVDQAPAPIGAVSSPTKKMMIKLKNPATMEMSATRGDVDLRTNTAYKTGPSVPAETPEIPVHIKLPKKSGGCRTSKHANT